MGSTEFLRWYWLKSELVSFAKQQSLGTTGDKPTLTDRIAAHLDGAQPAIGTATVKISRATVSLRLLEPLTMDTVLGPKQSSSQQLRSFFVEAVGAQFVYDIHMRTFLASDRHKTLGEAVEHWYSSRGAAKPETLPQLEFVRFTRAWHRQNPARSQKECRSAWTVYRSLPRDERPELPGF